MQKKVSSSPICTHQDAQLASQILFSREQEWLCHMSLVRQGQIAKTGAMSPNPLFLASRRASLLIRAQKQQQCPDQRHCWRAGDELRVGPSVGRGGKCPAAHPRSAVWGAVSRLCTLTCFAQHSVSLCAYCAFLLSRKCLKYNSSKCITFSPTRNLLRIL